MSTHQAPQQTNGSGAEMVCSAGGFGQELRRVRQAAGLSQVQCASKAKVHPSLIGLYERGERGPSVSAIAQLSHALGLGAVDEYRLLSAALADARALLGLEACSHEH